MTSIPAPLRRRIVVGVDTHKYVHVAVALDQVGAVIGDVSVPADRVGCTQLQQWASELGQRVDFGVEGCGSYGAGLVSVLRRRGHLVIEVNRPARQVRYLRGKNDTIDAENAARAVLSGTATAVPKTADSTVEMIRQIKIAKDTAVKSRGQAMITLKTIVVTAPAELREALDRSPTRNCWRNAENCGTNQWTIPPTRPATRCARSPTDTGLSIRKPAVTTASSPPSPTGPPQR